MQKASLLARDDLTIAGVSEAAGTNNCRILKIRHASQSYCAAVT